ncbi:tyrosine recombinase XerC [Streptomyces paromomycinus]|uniref:Site-specific integrase n=1 Tax=Streptomyces paromomycinus TaxID=92743 RepID=A0A401W5T8_STREY|nr:tyrosine-type recombinase/integrase [Streptomyces paromomycinus]GCD44700.1 site-specific integrase [Streptomyces paromomycinus]
MKGSTHRRCYCRDPKTGKPLGKSCPKLSSRKHGSYSMRQELPPREDGTRRSFSRAGYESLKAAQADLDHIRALIGLADADCPEDLARIADLLEEVADAKAPLPDIEATRRRLRHGLDLTSRLTVGEWLDEWFAAKKVRKTTANGYASHLRVHLKPRIGHIRLDRLNVGHLVEMFDGIADDNEVIIAENAARREQIARCKPSSPGRPTAAERARLAEEQAVLARMKPFRKVAGPATRQSIRRTLRAALNGAIAQQLITFNPAAHVQLESGKRPKPLLWTDQRVQRWLATGEKPSPVMVWTPAQFGIFLDAAEGDRLYALFHLIGTRGLRRGEAVGQDWTETDLDAGLITPAKEIVVDGWDPYESAPKTDGSASTIALDSLNVAVLRAHRERQEQERQQWGPAWQDTGKVFTQEDGSWLHPETVSETFRRILAVTGLPPITLRDLRHVAATLTHGGGGDLHTIKETLRHSTITLTSDTYTSLLPEVDQAAAEAAARLIPRARPVSGTAGAGPSAHASRTHGTENAVAPRSDKTDEGAT